MWDQFLDMYVPTVKIAGIGLFLFVGIHTFIRPEMRSSGMPARILGSVILAAIAAVLFMWAWPVFVAGVIVHYFETRKNTSTP